MPDVTEDGLPIFKSPASVTEDGLPIFKKKVSAAGSGNGSQPSGTGLAPFQSFQIDTSKPVPLQRPHPTSYVKPKVKPKSITESVDDDNSYLGAIYNQLVNSGSDFVGGMTRMIAKNSQVPGLSAVGDVLGDKAQQLIEKARTSSSSQANEEAIQGGLDLSNGISMEDAKSLPLFISRFAADAGLSIPTAGASFLAQGYNQGLKEYDTATEGEKTDPNTRELFGMAYGAINGVADRLSLGFLTKNNPVAKNVKKAILRETIQELAKGTGKITADVIEETASRIAKKSINKMKAVGLKGLTSAAVEGGTEGLQGAGSDALKLLTNKLSDEEVFNQKEITENFLKNRLNDVGAGAALDGLAGAGMRGIQSTNNIIANRVAEATTPEQVEAIKSEIIAEVENGNLDGERANALVASVDKFAQATSKLPRDLSASQREKIIKIIVNRDDLQERIAQDKADLAAADEALASQGQQEVDILEAKKQSLNDDIVETTAEEKFKYFKDPEKDKWYKQLGEDGVTEEITKQQYDLEKQSAPRVEEPLVKAETDLEALKQVNDKVKKYEASMKRLTDAKNAKQITEAEFNQMKSRFDDVMGGSAPAAPATEEVVDVSMRPVLEPTSNPDDLSIELNPEDNAISQQTANEVPLQPTSTDSGEVEAGIPQSELEVSTQESESLSEETALRNADIEAKREELGFEPFEDVEPTTFEATTKQATDQIREEGFDAKTLIDNILTKNTPITDQDVVALKQYQLAKENELVSLNDDIIATVGNPTAMKTLIAQRDIALNELNNAQQAGRKAGTITARALNARKIKMLQDFSLANMFIRKFQANGDAPLSEQQKQEVTKAYSDIKSKNEALQAKVKELEARSIDTLAEKARIRLDKEAKREAKKMGHVQTREFLDKEISDTIASFKEKLKKQRSKLNSTPLPVEAIADIVKLAKLYTQKGAVSLQEVVDKIHNDLEDTLTRDEIKTILASDEYNGDPRLKSYKTRTSNRIEDLRERTNSGNFSKRIVTPIQLDEEALDLRDALLKAKHDYQLTLEKDKLSKRTKSEKLIDDVNNIKGLVKSLKATWDLSAPFRQGIFASVVHPQVAMKAMYTMHKNAFSQKAFDRWENDLKSTPLYDLMKESGLAISDSKSPNLLAREEDFTSNLAEKIPALGNLTKGSERAYSTYLNYLRAYTFMDSANQLMLDGMTPENSPQEFKSLASSINNATGRGGLGKLEKHAALASFFLWSPRLISSRINLFTSIFDPAYTPRQRKQNAIDMAKFIATVTTVMFLFSNSEDDTGIKIEWNPLSSDFGKAKRGNVRTSLMGGAESYITLMARVLTGKTKTKGKVKDLNPSVFGGRSRLDYLYDFARGKASPDIGILLNLMDGENVVGEEYKLWDVPDEILPMVVPEVVDAYAEGGAEEVLKVLPFTTYGFNVNRYSDKGKKRRKEGVFENMYNKTEKLINKISNGKE